MQHDPVRYVTVIAYDTPSNRRRRKLARLADDFGDRVQKSVFEAHLTDEQRQRLVAALHRLVHPSEDAVFVMAACPRCALTIVRLGAMRSSALPMCWIA
ncbi:MAG: CRISPR-associated endonuclease Cas2 [Phycisphaerales bacterium]